MYVWLLYTVSAHAFHENATCNIADAYRYCPVVKRTIQTRYELYIELVNEHHLPLWLTYTTPFVITADLYMESYSIRMITLPLYYNIDSTVKLYYRDNPATVSWHDGIREWTPAVYKDCPMPEIRYRQLTRDEFAGPEILTERIAPPRTFVIDSVLSLLIDKQRKSLEYLLKKFWSMPDDIAIEDYYTDNPPYIANPHVCEDCCGCGRMNLTRYMASMPPYNAWTSRLPGFCPLDGNRTSWAYQWDSPKAVQTRLLWSWEYRRVWRLERSCDCSFQINTGIYAFLCSCGAKPSQIYSVFESESHQFNPLNGDRFCYANEWDSPKAILNRRRWWMSHDRGVRLMQQQLDRFTSSDYYRRFVESPEYIHFVETILKGHALHLLT